MGPIYDRSQEHLGISDITVITVRKFLLQCVRAVQAGKEAAARREHELLEELRDAGEEP